MSKRLFFKGTFILTCAGFLTRIMGFFYRIFLSHSIGAHGMGIYQLVVPLQMLAMAISASGIQFAVSRFVASHIAVGKEKKARDYFVLGTFLAVSCSVLLSVLVYGNADFCACEILKEPKSLSLVKLLAFSFPLSAVHSCVAGYYFARKKTEIPSAIQLLEQICRIGVTYLLYLIFLSEGKEITPVIAMGGSLASEFVSAFVSLFVIGIGFHKSKYHIFSITQAPACIKNILDMAIPHSLNRILVSLLGSMEVVMIPQRLRMNGLSSQDALSVYGVFTGMALPLILFPSTIINSASVMLMPSIAEFQALGYQKRIRYVILNTCRYCLMLGGTAGIFFFFFGNYLGSLLFSSPTAGVYIHTMAFICPFLYLNTALASILNGLGKSGRCLVHNVTGITVRILFVVFGIPVLGIRGYLYGILSSELVRCGLHLWALSRTKTVSTPSYPAE